MASDEKVLCLERRRFDSLGSFQGISLDVERYRSLWDCPPELLDYRPRSRVETDESYKQLIPYVMVLHQDRLLRYQRGTGSGEKRLLGLYSVGVGGHIAAEDGDLFDATGYREGTLREMREEVRLEAMESGWTGPVALINDDSTEVGRVHLGVVHLMRSADDRCVGRRSGILRPGFHPWRDLARESRERPGRYEFWSALCLEHFESLRDRAG